jgi:transposase InsO family protein
MPGVTGTASWASGTPAPDRGGRRPTARSNDSTDPARGWAYKRLYTSEKNRRAALADLLHTYNHHRPHTALGNLPPISRCTNVREQYN